MLLVCVAALVLLHHFDFSKISPHSNDKYLSSYNAVNGSFVARGADDTYYWTDTGLVMHLDAEGNREVVLKDSTSNSFYFYNSTLYEKLLDKIEPQRFRYKRDEDDAPYHIGYIAQDVLAALEDVGLDRRDLAAVAGEEGDLGIAYSELVPVLHKKVKSLEARIVQLEGLIAKLLKAQGMDVDTIEEE